MQTTDSAPQLEHLKVLQPLLQKRCLKTVINLLLYSSFSDTAVNDLAMTLLTISVSFRSTRLL